MNRIRRTTGRAWLWFTEDAPDGAYDAIRVAVGVGGGLLLATWVNGHHPGVVLGVQPENTLAYDSSTWWVALALGMLCAGSLVLGRFPRLAAGGLFAALQLCGGYLVNWAGLAVQLAAVLLVFAGGKRTPVWPKRVLQVQLPLGYAVAVVSKFLIGTQWRTLDAFSTMTQHPMNRYAWPTIPAPMAPMFDVLGVFLEGGAAVALTVAVLTGNRWWRRVGLGCSAALHLGISVFVPVGLFLFAVLPFWLAHGANRRVPTQIRYVALGLIVATLSASIIIDSNPFTTLQ